MSAVIITERVRYAETDQMGVAYHGVYPAWFEIGRTAYCREKGVIYAELEKQGFGLVVVELSVQYKQPLHYDEEFAIATHVTQANSKLIEFSYSITKKGALC